jgi:ABC-type Fe3+-hydroxamate transport system substrate-binding protein
MPLANHHLNKDMMGREVRLPKKPQRIISLVPSITELLASLELNERVVGITKFCIHPSQWKNTKVQIGGTKKINRKKIRDLKPDMIIANKEENSIEDIEALSSEFPVWVTDINSFDDALHAIEWLGELTQSEKQAKRVIFSIHKAWSAIPLHTYPIKTCAYLIWKDPYMTVGQHTYINSILEKIHLKNVIGDARYPEITPKELRETNPEILFLSSEPFPFKEKHKKELEKLIPSAKLVLVDGEMFSWYGSRMRFAADYFNELLPEIHDK